jgi:3-oxoisoapionate decarboxylase
MKLGLSTYTYTWAIGIPGYPPREPLTALALLRRADQIGVRVVQFCDNYPLTAQWAMDLATAGAVRDKDLQRSLNELTDFARERCITIEIGTRGIADTANLLGHLELAKRFGAPFVRLVVDAKGHEPSPEDCVSRLCPLLPHFAEAGVKLALENHDRFSSATLAQIVETLGPDYVGICLDTANSFGALEGPDVVVKTLAPYTLNLHVKDFTIARVSSQLGFVISGCAAGQGRLNIPWLLEQLRTAGRDVNAILELWTPFGPTLEGTIAREVAWAEESVRYVRQFIPD